MLDPSGQYHAFAERGAGRDPSGCHAFAERGTGLAYDEDMKKGVERNEYTHTTHPPSPAVSFWAYGQVPLCLPMRHTASTLVATCVKHTWPHAPAHTSTRCVRARARGSRHPSPQVRTKGSRLTCLRGDTQRMTRFRVPAAFDRPLKKTAKGQLPGKGVGFDPRQDAL